jgi:hypothetical protein
MSADTGSLIITALSFNGTDFGIAQNISADLPVGVAPLQNQGALGTSAIGVISKGGVIVVTWIAGAGSKLFTPGTKGDIVAVSQDAKNGGTQSRTFPDMVALDGKLMHSDRSYAIYSQTFMNESEDGEFTDVQQ